MVTIGLTKKQKAGLILPRLKKFTKKEIRFLEEQHKRIVEGQIRQHGSERLDRFESHYLAEYNAFSRPTRITKRIEFRKDPKTGRKIRTGFFFQVVYKDPKTGRNLPSPLRDYITFVNKKIDEATKFTIHGEEAKHLKDHLQYKLQQKHIDSLRALIKARRKVSVGIVEK